MRFRDRADAGRRLAGMLLPYRGEDVSVLGVARGGLRVAFEVARALEAPLDVWVALRVGVPSQTGSVGAVSEGGGLYLDRDALRLLSIPELEIQNLAADEAFEVNREVQRLRARPLPEVPHHTVLLVDDGAVTGVTLCASLRALRHRMPRRLVVGVPVSTPRALERVRAEADVVHCLEVMPALTTVAEAYDDFRAIPDVEVQRLLEIARQPWPSRSVLESTDLGGYWF